MHPSLHGNSNRSLAEGSGIMTLGSEESEKRSETTENGYFVFDFIFHFSHQRYNCPDMRIITII